jgi:hypothetical protein
MPQATEEFSPTDPTTIGPYLFNFTPFLSPGESISTATWALSVISGTDASPASHLVGTPAISGNAVTQVIGNLIGGVTYLALSTIVTSLGNQYSLWSDLYCTPIPTTSTGAVTTTPTEADWLANFVRLNMGITTDYLPNTSPAIDWAYQVAVSIVNPDLALTDGPIYLLAVYNLAASNLINFAQDQPGQVYFSALRDKYNINSFVSGIISSSSDQGTSESLVTPKVFEDLTLADLQYLKDPYGRQYLMFAQRAGTLWGIT